MHADLNLNMLKSETASILSRYPDDQNLINSWYSEYMYGVEGINNYLIKLIGFCRAKEDYKCCASLLSIKKAIV